MVPEKFHKWIKVFGKKQLERMPTRKVCVMIQSSRDSKLKRLSNELTLVLSDTRELNRVSNTK